MKKSTGIDDKDCTEEALNPKLVFSDDSLVVDYLNALLASSPTMNLDSREIQFVHLVSGVEWKPASMANASGSGTNFFNADFSKLEAVELRRENETLKFKTELAEIDAQVLRSENDNLKEDVVSLTLQLNDMSSALNEMVLQADDLRSKIVQIQNQQNHLPIAAFQGHSDSVLETADTMMEQYLEDELESECGAVAPVQPEDPAAVPVQKPVFDEIVPYHISDVKNPPLYKNDDSGAGLDPALISQLHVVSNSVAQKSGSGGAVFSSRQVPGGSFVQQANPVSKIIKQNHAGKYQRPQETLQTVVLQPSVLSVEEKAAKVKVDLSSAATCQQLIDEPAITDVDNIVSNKDLLNIDELADIELEQVPSPKVVVQRNVKNYEDLQKETDTPTAATAGHTIVL